MTKIIAATLVIGLSLTVSAEPKCTKEPKDVWQDQAAFQKKLVDQGYKIKKFKVTKGDCFEIYGKNKDNKKVEIYFNPVTGEKIKEEID